MKARRYRPTQSDQLRVRLTPAERQSLERLVEQRTNGGTLSDVVREALAWCLHPTSHQQPCFLSSPTMAKVQRLAVGLNRSPDQVVEDCIQGVLDLIEDGRTPLIVQEVRLRQSYSSSRK